MIRRGKKIILLYMGKKGQSDNGDAVREKENLMKQDAEIVLGKGMAVFGVFELLEATIASS